MPEGPANAHAPTMTGEPCRGEHAVGEVAEREQPRQRGAEVAEVPDHARGHGRAEHQDPDQDGHQGLDHVVDDLGEGVDDADENHPDNRRDLPRYAGQMLEGIRPCRDMAGPDVDRYGDDEEEPHQWFEDACRPEEDALAGGHGVPGHLEHDEGLNRDADQEEPADVGPEENDEPRP
jgi:hypothetical protein